MRNEYKQNDNPPILIWMTSLAVDTTISRLFSYSANKYIVTLITARTTILQVFIGTKQKFVR